MPDLRLGCRRGIREPDHGHAPRPKNHLRSGAARRARRSVPGATDLGDTDRIPRHDDRWPDATDAGRSARLEVYARHRDRLSELADDELSDDEQIDRALVV